MPKAVWENGLLIDGDRPKSMRRYVWNGYPAKLGIRAAHMPDEPGVMPVDDNGDEQGVLTLRRGDCVDLRPDMQRRLAMQMRKGLLVEVEDDIVSIPIEELPEPHRRSIPKLKKTATERQTADEAKVEADAEPEAPAPKPKAKPEPKTEKE